MIPNRVLLFLTICFVTPSLSNFCQKIISFQFFGMGVTSLPPIWTMSLNRLGFFWTAHLRVAVVVVSIFVVVIIGFTYNEVNKSFQCKKGGLSLLALGS